MHDLRAHLLRLRHQGQHRLETDTRHGVAPVRGDLPRAGEKQDRPGIARMHPLQGADRAPEAPEGQGCPDRRDRRRERPGRDRAGSGRCHQARRQVCADETPLPLHELRHGADGPRHRPPEARSAGRGHEARSKEAEKILTPALAPRGMVACPNALASSAGVDVLRAGGSAVDAAIAAASVLGVVYPHMCGIGGDAFALVYDAKSRKVSFLDGGGRAARAATLDRFAGQSEIPFRGLVPATLTTPGAVAGFCEAHARHGRLPLARCLQDAIHYARDGFPVTARLARWIEQTGPEFDAATAAIFLRGAKRIANPKLATTLQAIAAQGRAGFYEGEVARGLAKLGGFFTADDLAAQRAHWGEPIRGTYRGVTIYETPPPTQGFTVLEMLNLVEPFELRNKTFQGPDHVHLLVQAKQLAYHDRDHRLADPRFARVPVEQLLSKSYAEKRRALIDPQRALPWDKVPSDDSLKGDTVYVAVVDADGNAASLIF